MTSEERSPADPTTAPALSRRDFLRQVGAGFVALGAIGLGSADLLHGPAPIELQLSSGVIAPDPALCIGCLSCEVACSRVHRDAGLSDVPRIRIFYDKHTAVDPKISSAFGDRGQFHQSPCLQCPDAPCHNVCPADALQIEPRTGVRFVKESNCIACGRCAAACPFPVFSEAKAVDELSLGQGKRLTYDPAKNVYTKCDLCYWRPEGPACAAACPVNVRIRQGIIKSDVMCLDVPAATRDHWGQQSQQDWTING